MDKLIEIAEPIPNAKRRVPNPTVPPKIHPVLTIIISINVLTQAIGLPVSLCKPVINPSRGPGPKLAIRYNPLANPTNKIPKTD